jgi:hypothetical protein
MPWKETSPRTSICRLHVENFGNPTWRGSEAKTVPLHRASRHAWIDIKTLQDGFLEDSLPAPSLVPFVLNAQIIVFPVEHVAEARITELAMS